MHYSTAKIAAVHEINTVCMYRLKYNSFPFLSTESRKIKYIYYLYPWCIHCKIEFVSLTPIPILFSTNTSKYKLLFCSTLCWFIFKRWRKRKSVFSKTNLNEIIFSNKEEPKSRWGVCFSFLNNCGDRCLQIKWKKKNRQRPSHFVFVALVTFCIKNVNLHLMDSKRFHEILDGGLIFLVLRSGRTLILGAWSCIGYLASSLGLCWVVRTEGLSQSNVWNY